MPYKLHCTLFTVFVWIAAFSQQKKIVQKPVVRQMVNPALNVKDDPSPIKFIQLKKDTPVYVPHYFYVQKIIIDSSINNDSIGFILQPKSAKKQTVALKNGTVDAIEAYFNFKIQKDTTLYPLVFTLKNISLSEDKEKDYRNGLFRYAYSFDYMYKGKPLTITSGEGRFTYTVHVSQNRHLDSAIARSLVLHLSEIEGYMKEAIESYPAFCKGVDNAAIYITNNSFTSDTLFFDGQQELMWDDFASTTAGGDNYYLPRIGFLFDPEIKYENGRVKMHVKTGAYFIKSSSWAGKKVKTSQMLTHLQYMFKLAGLQSLRLKAKIDTTDFTCEDYETELRQIMLNANKQFQVSLDDYSNQTLNGDNKKEQNRWQELIESQLSQCKIIK